MHDQIICMKSEWFWLVNFWEYVNRMGRKLIFCTLFIKFKSEHHFPIAYQMKIHENSHHSHFPIVSRQKCMKILIKISYHLPPNKKSHHNHAPRWKYMKNLITITSQLLSDENAWKISSKSHTIRLLTKNLITIMLLDENTWKISSQSLPNCF